MDRSKDFELFLEHILGLMVIDKQGRLIYLNRQCADFIKVDPVRSIGKDIQEVFPPSKMKTMLTGNQRFNTDFYFYDGRTSVSTQVQILNEGQVVGVLEYDVFQELDSLDALYEKYAVSLRDEMKYYRDQFRKLGSTKYSIDNIVGSSQKVQDLKKQIRMAAATSSTVIITGETGTGKELVAHSIHNLSSRAFGSFIKINAAGFPESLAESEFFGYEEGAFTGAKKGGKKGKFELANEGTLFIDEINQMPMNLQPKILRALQEHEIDRVGGDQSIKINARIIAASNQDLAKQVEKEKFREDLFYRLNVLPIVTPPLRERMEDLPELVMDRINGLNQEFGKCVVKVDASVYSVLSSYDWPGNVRELYNVIEKAMNYVEGSTLGPEHINFPSLKRGDLMPGLNKTNLEFFSGEHNPIEMAKAEAERQIILQALKLFGGNKTKAAEYLKISRPLLYQKIKRLGI